MKNLKSNFELNKKRIIKKDYNWKKGLMVLV